MVSNVISLAEVRNARIAEERKQLYDMNVSDVVERILNLPSTLISAGATMLLLKMSYVMGQGHHYMGYPYLVELMGGISTRTLSNYLTELEESKLLRIRRSRVGKCNATNQFEIDFTGPLKDAMGKLKLPKKASEMGTVKSKVPTEGVLQKVKGYNIYKDKEERLSKDNQRPSAQQFETVAEALSFSEKRIIRTRTKKVEKTKKLFAALTLAGVKATWTTAMLKYHPSVPPLAMTGKDMAIFKSRMQPLLATANISEIFDYFISNWSALRENKFKWLRAKGKDVALAPSIPELMRYWKVFAQAYADSRMVQANTADNAKQRSEADELRDQLAVANARAKKEELERRQLQDKLVKAERRAAVPIVIPPEEKVSLSERRRRADKAYDATAEIPAWGSQ